LVCIVRDAGECEDGVEERGELEFAVHHFKLGVEGRELMT